MRTRRLCAGRRGHEAWIALGLGLCLCLGITCDRAGHVLGGEGKKPSPAKAAALGPRVPNLADAWARVHLARLCAALLLAEWTSAGEFAGGMGAPLLRMLVLLATRCAAPDQNRSDLALFVGVSWCSIVVASCRGARGAPGCTICCPRQEHMPESQNKRCVPVQLSGYYLQP